MFTLIARLEEAEAFDLQNDICNTCIAAESHSQDSNCDNHHKVQHHHAPPPQGSPHLAWLLSCILHKDVNYNSVNGIQLTVNWSTQVQ